MSDVMTLKDAARRAARHPAGMHLLVLPAHELTALLIDGGVNCVRDISVPPAGMKPAGWFGAEPWLPPDKRTPRRHRWEGDGTTRPSDEWHEATCPFGSVGDIFLVAGRTLGMPTTYCIGSDAHAYYWKAEKGWVRAEHARDGRVTVYFSSGMNKRYAVRTLMAETFGSAMAGLRRITVRMECVEIYLTPAGKWQWTATAVAKAEGRGTWSAGDNLTPTKG